MAERAEPTRVAAPPSVALLVDDLATWLVAGRHPTGIQRVVSELLETAYSRTDIDAWAAVTLGSSETGAERGIRAVSPESLRWEAHRSRTSAALRLMRWAQPRIARLEIPEPVRRPIRTTYGRLSLVLGGVQPSERPDSRLDLLLVPGSFWAGDSTRHLVRLAQSGVTVRMIVHDLFPIHHPEWCGERLVRDFSLAIDKLLPVSDRIVTLSSDVARQVSERYPETRDRIRVGVPTLEAHARRGTSPTAPAPAGLAGRYLLALGTVEPRKNHRTIIDAWRIARADPRAAGAQLAIAGRLGWKAEDIEAEVLRDGAQLGIIRLANATDEHVEALYQGCAATVNASWEEGFGLPVRESIVRGVPAIVSTGIPRDGLPDGACRWFDPSDVEALAHLMVEALTEQWSVPPLDLGSGTGWEPVLSALVD